MARGLAEHGAPRDDLLRRARGGAGGRDASTVCATCAAGPAWRSTCWGCCTSCCAASAGSTWSSTPRTACRSSPGWPRGSPWWCSSTTSTVSSGPSCSRGGSGGSAGSSRSGVAPALYRGCQYVAVSQATTARAHRAGHRRATGSRWSTTGRRRPRRCRARRDRAPLLTVVGRLVPHKQVEHAIDALVGLRAEVPGIRLCVVGSGWWEDNVRKYAAERGVGRPRHLRRPRHRGGEARDPGPLLAAAAALAQGGLGARGRRGRRLTGCRRWPTRPPAGPGRASQHDVSGLLAPTRRTSQPASGARARRRERRRLGRGAREMSHPFTWGHSQESFALVLDDVRCAGVGRARRTRRRRTPAS